MLPLGSLSSDTSYRLNSKRKRTPFSLWLRPGSHNRGRGKLALVDRDGFLIADTGYPHQPHQLELLPSGIALCRRWRRQGYALVIVTNQSGVARGFFSARDYAHFTQLMLEAFARQGIFFRAVLACPHHPQGTLASGQRKFCLCRKPRPALASKAMRVLRIPPQRCLVAGDRMRDLTPGQRLGIAKRYLVPSSTPSAPDRPYCWRPRSFGVGAGRNSRDHAHYAHRNSALRLLQ